MSLNVLKYGSRIVQLHSFIEKDSIGLFFQIAPYFNHK
jgi:hypothetical protein